MELNEIQQLLYNEYRYSAHVPILFCLTLTL